MSSVVLYDTTLRDGMQGEGMSLSAEEKVRVAHALDTLGVQFVEAGFLSSNPKDERVFELLESEPFMNATIVAFGMTRRRGVRASADAGLRLMAESWVPACCLVSKTWKLHLEKVTKVDPDENLAMIGDSVGFLAQQGKRVVYDCEHFFDAYRDDAAYAIRCVETAAEAGAENVTLCDTNGSSLPPQIRAATEHVVRELGERVSIGIHTHDDAGCGVANALVAVEGGARLVQGTVNGYGGRCGKANLATILPGLPLEMGYGVVSSDQR